MDDNEDQKEEDEVPAPVFNPVTVMPTLAIRAASTPTLPTTPEESPEEEAADSSVTSTAITAASALSFAGASPVGAKPFVSVLSAMSGTSTQLPATPEQSTSLPNHFPRSYSLSLGSLGSLGPPPLSGAPPCYSVAMAAATARERPPILPQASPPFIAPGPPPSYAVAHGLYMDFPITILRTQSSTATHWSPRPLPVVCPRCGALVVTNIRSNWTAVTHLSALLLCICGCWPCCILPYCIDACKNTYHTCPACQQYLGSYTPW